MDLSTFRKPVPRSQRRSVGRRSGAQPGREGTNLERVADPGQTIEHRPGACDSCGSTLAPDAVASGFAWGTGLRPARAAPCGDRTLDADGAVRVRMPHVASGPDGVTAPGRYRPGITALAVYTQVQQHLPSARTAALAPDVFAAGLSEGFAGGVFERAATRPEPFADHVKALLQHSKRGRSDEEIAAFKKRSDQAVHVGRAVNPGPQPGGKKRFTHQLADRIHRRPDDFLRLLHDLTVPSTNNQAEQDIRMIKIQAKISGGWRTLTGANRWLLACSCLSAPRKHGQSPLLSLTHSPKPLAVARSPVIKDLISHAESSQ